MATLRHATHNQGDRAESPASGWDVQCLTERSPSPAPEWAERYSPGIKGLAIDWNPDVFDVEHKFNVVVHPGASKISPSRGTLWVTGRLTTAPAVKVAVVCSHRINDPDGSTRLGGAWRRMVWKAHALFDARLFKSLERRDFLVLYGGDINDRTATLHPLRRLLDGHYDALGYSRDPRIKLTDLDKNGRTASDHSRFTATYSIKESK